MLAYKNEFLQNYQIFRVFTKLTTKAHAMLIHMYLKIMKNLSMFDNINGKRILALEILEQHRLHPYKSFEN